MQTILADRVLWYDGSQTVPNEQFMASVISGVRGVHPETLTDEMVQYNSYVTSNERIVIKDSCILPTRVWLYPPSYDSINLHDFFMDKLDDNCHHMSAVQFAPRYNRAIAELAAFEERGLSSVLRCSLYIIDKFIEAGIVWGVGRGSSVACYLLYLAGLHEVDSVEFNLDFSSFLTPGDRYE